MSRREAQRSHAALEVSRQLAQRSQMLQNLTMLSVNFVASCECSWQVWDHFASLHGGLGTSRITGDHRWGPQKGMEGLNVASGPIYVLLMCGNAAVIHVADDSSLLCEPDCGNKHWNNGIGNLSVSLSTITRYIEVYFKGFIYMYYQRTMHWWRRKYMKIV